MLKCQITAGYTFEHRCAVESEEEAQKILEVFPDAIVEVNEELYESIPEEDREDAEGIIEKGARDNGDGNFEEERDTVNEGSTSTPISGASIVELAEWIMTETV